MSSADGGIDRRNAERIVPMKVIVLGLSRTGTNSMRTALQRLGYLDTYHGFSCWIENQKDMLLWKEAIDAKFYGIGKPYTKAQWDALLGHCQAVSDMPCNLFGEELVEMYPEAKVVLTQRPFEQWFHSMDAALVPAFSRYTFQERPWEFVRDLFRDYMIPACWLRYRTGLHIWDASFGNARNWTKEHARGIYDEYYTRTDKLLDALPQERVLRFDVKEGWGPLCKFLGDHEPTTNMLVETPLPTPMVEKDVSSLEGDEEGVREKRSIAAAKSMTMTSVPIRFPRANDSSTFTKIVIQGQRKMYMNHALKLLAFWTFALTMIALLMMHRQQAFQYSVDLMLAATN